MASTCFPNPQRVPTSEKFSEVLVVNFQGICSAPFPGNEVKASGVPAKFRNVSSESERITSNLESRKRFPGDNGSGFPGIS